MRVESKSGYAMKLPVFLLMILALAGLLLAQGLPFPGIMPKPATGSAPAYVKGCQNRVYSGTTDTCVFSGGVTSGHLLVCAAVSQTSQSLTSFTGTSGKCSGTWTLLDPNTAGQGGGILGSSGSSVANGTGACTVTATWAAGVDEGDIVCHEVSGQNASPIDAHAINGTLAYGNYNTADSLTSGNVSDASANDYVFGWAAFLNGPTFVAGTGYTAKEATSVLMSETKTATSSGNVAATASQSSANQTSAILVGIVTVKP